MIHVDTPLYSLQSPYMSVQFFPALRLFINKSSEYTRSNVNRIEIHSYGCRRLFTFSYIKTFKFFL